MAILDVYMQGGAPVWNRKVGGHITPISLWFIADISTMCAPPVINWFVTMVTSTISYSYWSYKPT